MPNLPPALEGLRILHVTDFHLHRFWKSPYDELLGRIRRDPPDLLLSTGDYVEDKRNHRPALPMVAAAGRRLPRRLGVLRHPRQPRPPLDGAAAARGTNRIDAHRRGTGGSIPFGDGAPRSS